VSRSTTQKLLLAIIGTDKTFERLVIGAGEEAWVGKCLHCNTRLTVAIDGTPISRATIEHIVPKALGGTDELANLGVACSRCNHEKGVRHDPKGLGDPKLQAMIARLKERRRKRWRDPDDDSA
jgi:5-methylcytosine-specific restriction endonuclease McrA